jgi:hypothetical protein
VSATNWAALVNTLATNGNTISVTLPVTKTNEFFRLKNQ